MVNSLPKKGSDALQRFLICLMKSRNGTGHEELARIIQEKAESVTGKISSKSDSESWSLNWWQVAILSIVVLPLACVLLYYSLPLLLYNLNLRENSKTLPYSLETFIGREKEVDELVNLLDFHNPLIRTVNVVESPGFGKSTLTVYVGYEMVKQGVVVLYLGMSDFPESQVKQVLAETILRNLCTLQVDTPFIFDDLLLWAKDRYWYTCTPHS